MKNLLLFTLFLLFLSCSNEITEEEWKDRLEEVVKSQADAPDAYDFRDFEVLDTPLEEMEIYWHYVYVLEQKTLALQQEQEAKRENSENTIASYLLEDIAFFEGKVKQFEKNYTNPHYRVIYNRVPSDPRSSLTETAYVNKKFKFMGKFSSYSPNRRPPYPLNGDND